MSQIVNAMMTPKPAIQTKRPSETGPKAPRSAPPGEPLASICFRKVMMSRFPSGEMFASLKTGMFWGPVTMAS